MKAKQKQLILYVAVSLLISAIPIVSWPFNWIETYFHEMSHGLIALFTGGHIEQIVIRVDGSGYCSHIGGSIGLTAFAGYFGAIASGAAMYFSARLLNKKAMLVSGFMMISVALTGIFYARDIITIAIVVTIISLFYFASSSIFSQYFNRAEEFIGIYVLTNAIRAPLHLFDGRNIGDGATLSELTFIPEFVWAGIWFFIGIIALVILWLYEKDNSTYK